MLSDGIKLYEVEIVLIEANVKQTKPNELAQDNAKFFFNTQNPSCFILFNKCPHLEQLKSLLIQYAIKIVRKAEDNKVREVIQMQNVSIDTFLKLTSKIIEISSKKVEINFVSNPPNEKAFLKLIEEILFQETKETLKNEDGLRNYLDHIKIWSQVKDMKLIYNRSLSEYLIENKNEKLLNKLIDMKCGIKYDRFIQNADLDRFNFLLQLKILTRESFEKDCPLHTLAYSSICYPLKINSFKSIYKAFTEHNDPIDMLSLIRTKSRRHFNLDLIEYCCYIQAGEMLETVLETDRVLKYIDDAVNYDVTNLIPETLFQSKDSPKTSNKNSKIEFVSVGIKENMQQNKSDKQLPFPNIENNNTIVLRSLLKPEENREELKVLCKLSCLERILASTVKCEIKAASMLESVPLLYLVQDYVLWAKSIHIAMFFSQIIYMICFTIYFLSSLSDSNKQGSEIINNQEIKNETKINDSEHLQNAIKTYKNTIPLKILTKNILNLLWMIWPLIVLLLSLIQFWEFKKLVILANYNFFVFSKVKAFPWYNSILLLSIISWSLAHSFDINLNSYYELVALIMILGWIRPLSYFSFCTQWNAFMIALQSSTLKYVISFVFVFSFVFLGFNFAFRSLLTPLDGTDDTKNLTSILYTTYITVFGMGELTNFPAEFDSEKNQIFLQMTICAYISVLAALVLGILRQPDDEVVGKVSFKRNQRVKLGLIINILWMFKFRQNRNSNKWKGSNFAGTCFYFKKIFRYIDFAKETINDRFWLRIVVKRKVEIDEKYQEEDENRDSDKRENNSSYNELELAEIKDQIYSVKKSINGLEEKINSILNLLQKKMIA